MNNSKIISIIQMDNSQETNSLLRGLSVCFIKKKQSNIIIDLRPNSSIVWSYYGKKNIKFVDDILNVITNVNMSILKTYFDIDSDILCVKNENVLQNDNFIFLIKILSEIYDNIMISCLSNQIIDKIIPLTEITLIQIQEDPISLLNYKQLYSSILVKSIKNMQLIPIVFESDISFNIDRQNKDFIQDNTLFLNFKNNIKNEIEQINFMFNDDKNEFVKGINKIIETICGDNKQKNISDENYYSIDSQRYISLKERLHKDLVSEIKEYSKEDDKQKIFDAIKIKVYELLKKYTIEIPISIQDRLIKELTDDIAGLSVLEDLLADNTITEIMVNGLDNIYVEQNGKIKQTDIKFSDVEKLKTVISRIVATIGRHVDEASPIVDARLKDGSRVNVVLSPISMNGPILTIRKFSKHKLSAQELINFNSLSIEMLEYLQQAVKNKKNILISGGTGSGKTTLLNALSAFIDENERIITIEDSAELQLQQSHVIKLESRPKSLEGTSEINIRQLVINSLRMRPDRIIVGECRSAETLDMLQAMNTGHSGSMTTVHSNSCEDAISRLVVMSLMSGFELPEKSIISMITSAIDIVVQIKRCSNGLRKVSEICCLEKSDKDIYKLIPLFKYDEQNNQFIRN